MTAELVLHLELDGFEVSNQKDTVKDLSGHNHAGELKGNVAIVADDLRRLRKLRRGQQKLYRSSLRPIIEDHGRCDR